MLRSELLQSGMDLKRSQLDTGKWHDKFWIGSVAHKLYEAAFMPDINLMEFLDGVDVTMGKQTMMNQEGVDN